MQIDGAFARNGLAFNGSIGKGGQCRRTVLVLHTYGSGDQTNGPMIADVAATVVANEGEV